VVPADPLAPLLAQSDVRAAVDGARGQVDALLGHRLLRRRSAEVSAEAALRTARASAALAGSPHSLADVRAGLEDPTVHAALRVTSGLGALLETVDRAPLQALARLHALAARGLVDDAELGRPRPGPEVGARLAALADLLAARRTVSALVLAAVCHGELLSLDAFAPTSGLVARAAARLVLIARGLDPKAVVAVDVGHLEATEDYARAQAAYAAGDAVTWVVHCADAVRLGALDSLAVCEALVRDAEARA
jgi:hypothetical protein